MKQPWRDDRGITLTELLIAMTVATIIMAAAVTWVSAVTRSDERNQSMIETIDELRFAKSRLVSELRFGEDVFPPSSGDDSLSIWIDVNDNDIDDDAADIGERITFTITSSGELIRSSDLATEADILLAESLIPAQSSMVITDDIVDIELYADTDPSDNLVERSVRTTVKVRNKHP